MASKERTFNKLMTVSNLITANPQLADHFGQYYSYAKLWDNLLRTSGVDPMMLALDEDSEAPAGTAGGQLNPALPSGTGASAPNMAGAGIVPPGGGDASAQAATNPATNLNMGA